MKIYLKRELYVFLIIFSFISLIYLDTSIIKIYSILHKSQLSIDLKNCFFVIITTACLFLELIIIRYIKNLFIKNQLINTNRFKIVNTLVLLSQYSLMLLTSVIFFQVFYFGYYDTLILMLIVIISYGIPSVLLFRTAILFYRWYRVKRNTIPLLYFISLSLVTFSLVMTNVLVNISLFIRPDQIREDLGGYMNILIGKYEILNIYYSISTLLSFISIWFTTVILYHSSGSNLSTQLKYMILISFPLIYFLSGYFGQNIIYNFLFDLDFTNPVFISSLLILVFSLSRIIGGIVFGVVFWNASKLFPYDKLIKKYLLYTGIGFLFLFSANQFTFLAFSPYPPFGLATITILIFSSYLILVGISNSANLISKNTKLRQSIRQITKESKLLNLIGTAEMEHEMNKTIDKIIKNTQLTHIGNMKEMGREELRQYIERIIDELKK